MNQINSWLPFATVVRPSRMLTSLRSPVSSVTIWLTLRKKASDWYTNCIRTTHYLHKSMERREIATSAVNARASKNKKEDASISMDKNGRIVLRIHAKPNAKKSRVTEIGDSEIEVAIAAPPRDGQANDTLREAIAVILGLRKSDVSFDAGTRSRSKVVSVNSQHITIEEVREKLRQSANAD